MFTPFQPHDQFAYFSDGRYVIRRLYFTDCQREIPPKICGFLHSNTHITPIFLSRTSSYIALQAVKFSSHTYKNCVVYMEKPRWITHWPKSTRPQSETYINKNSPTEKKCQNIHDKTPKHYQHTIIFRRIFVTHTKNAHKLFEYYALIRLPTERIKKWDKNTFKTLILFGFVGIFCCWNHHNFARYQCTIVKWMIIPVSWWFCVCVRFFSVVLWLQKRCLLLFNIENVFEILAFGLLVYADYIPTLYANELDILWAFIADTFCTFSNH